MTDTTVPAATTNPDAAAAPTTEVAAAATEGSAPAPAPEEFVAVATDGAYYLIVGQFREAAEAQEAYAVLQEVERTTPLKIDGVIIATRAADGKIDIAKATDHSTKKGTKWGIAGGIALGVLFPPSILASAVSMGVLGAAIGKIRNVGHRSELAEELAGVMEPGTTGLIALVENTAVVEVEKALAKADKIVTKEVDRQVAAQIDREAAAAKDAIGS